jgi:hypothetical protein
LNLREDVRSEGAETVMAGAISSTVPRSEAQSAAVRRLQAERLFYVIAGVVMLIATLIGFRFFLLHGKGIGGGEITRQIVPLVVVHGLAMFSWIILFLVQSILILNRNPRLHMRLGVGGAVLAGIMVPLGSTAATLSARSNPDIYRYFGGPRFFLATMVGEMLSFGIFVAIAVVYRRRPEIHRPMMLLASLMIISGSLGRCPYIENFAIMPPLYVLGPALVLGAVFLVLHWGMTLKLSRSFAFGYAASVIASVVFVVVGHSAWWNQMVSAIVP